MFFNCAFLFVGDFDLAIPTSSSKSTIEGIAISFGGIEKSFLCYASTYFKKYTKVFVSRTYIIAFLFKIIFIELLISSAVGKSDQAPANLMTSSGQTDNVFSLIKSAIHLLFETPFFFTILFNFFSVFESR